MADKIRQIGFSPADMTECDAALVRDTILSGWITTGPKTKEFERRISQFCKTDRTVCLNSATAAMEMALHLLGVSDGDEVIVPAYTYTATASSAIHVGARVVMIDSRKDNVEMDYDALEAAITEHTKAVIPVDLAGIVCDYTRIFDIVERKKSLFHPTNAIQSAMSRIAVIADCAHAFGARQNGQPAGSIADFSAFSFHAVKNLTTAEGGALTWNLPFGKQPAEVQDETWNDWLYRRAMLLSLHGQNKDALAKSLLGGWEYDIAGPWYKCNMTDIAAALGLSQLKRYPDMLQRRREIVHQYNEGLSGLDVQVLNHYGNGYVTPEAALEAENPQTVSSHHLYLVRLNGKTREQTNAVMYKMGEMGIATNVHYKPLPLMTAYKALGLDIANYPNALALFSNEITLPLHTRLSDEDVNYLIHRFREIIK